MACPSVAGISPNVHDDQVDALGLIGQLLDVIRPGQILKPVQPPQKANGYSSMRRGGAGASWRVR